MLLDYIRGEVVVWSGKFWVRFDCSSVLKCRLDRDVFYFTVGDVVVSVNLGCVVIVGASDVLFCDVDDPCCIEMVVSIVGCYVSCAGYYWLCKWWFVGFYCFLVLWFVVWGF